MQRFFGLFSKAEPEYKKRIRMLIRRHFGFNPKNVDLYIMALRHSSSVPRKPGGLLASNERLEFLGDAVLDLIVADYLYVSHPNLSEGELTKMKSKVVSRKMLNNIGAQLEIVEHMETKLGGQSINQTIIGNALEALIGAIYLDKGYTFTSERVMEILHHNGIDEHVHMTVDFKSKLHEYCQKKRKTLYFIVLNDDEVDSDTRYTVEVMVDGKPLGRGFGKSKKAAEQESAREACSRLFGDIE